MKTWKYRYTTPWQVRTNKDKLIGSYNSVVDAEYIAEKGYSRSIYFWCNMHDKYVHYREYKRGE